MQPVNLADVMMALARSDPDRPAIVEGGSQLTCQQLVLRSAKFRTVLEGMGIAHGDLVGVACHNELDNITLYIALWLLNATPVPMDFRSRRAERAEYTTGFDLKAVVETRSPPGKGTYPAVRIDDAFQAAVVEATPKFERRDQEGSSLAFITLTSGTTGKPQGIAQSHECFYLRFMNLMTCRAGFNSGERYLSVLPSHFAGARAIMMYALLNGSTVQFLGPLFTVEEIAETIQRDRISSVWVVPSILRGMMALAVDDKVSFSGLDSLWCGGAAIDREIKLEAHRRLGPGFVEFFAASATGTISALYGDDLKTHTETVGRPFRHVLADIVDAEGNSLPRNEVGRLRIRAPGMPTGVLRFSEPGILPSEGVLDGWAYSGDLAAITDDGFLRLAGRVSDVIIRSGANVFPKEIEDVLIRHADVRDVCVVGIPSKELGEEIVAVVESEAPVDQSDLIAMCSRELSPHKRPRMFKFVDKLPRTEQGKLPRADVVALIGQSPDQES